MTQQNPNDCFDDQPLTRFAQRVRHTARRLDQIVEALDSLEFELTQFTGSSSQRRKGYSPESEALLKAVVKPSRIVILQARSKGGIVQIDESQKFAASNRLAALLRFLLEAPVGSDDLLGFRTAREVRKVLCLSETGLWNLAWRLRKQLLAEGHNPFLIQTGRDRIRFLTQKSILIDALAS